MAWLGEIASTKASKTEALVRTYHCTEMIFPKCRGYLTVTNKRVVFHGLCSKGGSWLDKTLMALQNFFGVKKTKTDGVSRIVTEIDVNTVSGVSSYYGHQTNILMLLLGLLVIIIPWSAFVALVKLFEASGTDLTPVAIVGVVALILSVAGIALICFCRRNVFFLKIFSSQATGAPISIGEGYGNLSGAKPLFALVGCPTDETDRMMTELGAIISDVKEMGDKAIELWHAKSSATTPASAPIAPTVDSTEDYLREAAKRLK